MAELPNQPWRSRWRQASFRGANFYVEVGAKQSGRRVALHEYPKRNEPYAEDMGRRAIRHSVTGYCIGPDYLGPRDALIDACEADGPGKLVHPLLGEMEVMCETYTCSESRERGGYATVEMQFVEAGQPGDGVPGTDTQGNVQMTSNVAELASVQSYGNQMGGGLSGAFGSVFGGGSGT